jgi:hypothetical protein
LQMARSRLVAALTLSSAVIGGCAAAFVPETSDPWKKYTYACALLGVNRPIPAERLLRESMTLFEKTDEYVRLAVVQLQYAQLIESPTFLNSQTLARRVADMGGVGAVANAARELDLNAKSNLLKALSTPATQRSPVDRTQALLVLIEAHARLGEVREACVAVERTAESYKQAEGIKYQYLMYPPGTVPEHLSQRRHSLSMRSKMRRLSWLPWRINDTARTTGRS